MPNEINGTVTTSGVVNGEVTPNGVVNGVIGIGKGDKGDSYVLTEADKAEIAAITKDIIICAVNGVTVQIDCGTADGESYQWKYTTDNGEHWYNASGSGYNTRYYSVTANATNDGRGYKCVVDGIETQPQYLKVVRRSLIVEQPPMQVYRIKSGTASISIVAADSVVNYQWYWRNRNSDGTYTNWNSSTATNATVELSATVPNGRQYRCKVTDANGNTEYSECANVVVLDVVTEISGKQDKLTAGENIVISGNTINAVDTIYDDTAVRDMIADKVSDVKVNGGSVVSAGVAAVGAYRIASGNKLAISQFLGILRSYYSNRLKSDGSNVFSYNHNTALDSTYENTNEIDCSTFVGLGLLGIDFAHSPYSQFASSTQEGQDSGNDSDDGSVEEDSDNDDTSTSTQLAVGDYPWVIDFRKIYYKKVNVEAPVRTASQMCQMMMESGWAVKFDENFSNIQRGDIVFYAKDADKKTLLIRVIRHYDSSYSESTLKNKTISELITICQSYVSGIGSMSTAEIKELAAGLGLPILMQPNRFRNVSHVAVVSSIYDNDGTYGIDDRFPHKHTLYEVSTFGHIVSNTTLEKRYPDRIVAVMRPEFGATSELDGSGNLSERIGETNIDKCSEAGVYYLISSNTGTLPSGETSLSGGQLIVRRAYNKWGKIYNITQTLILMSTSSSQSTVNRSKPRIYLRSNYCYAGGSYTFRSNFWSDWASVQTE